MKHLLLINPQNVSEADGEKFQVREAARAIVFDAENRIALLHVSKNEYYKLPGGGLEDSEDRILALKRECKEEIGCDIEVVKEIGSIVEYRAIFGIKQISYCYLAKLSGKKGEPSLTEYESSLGFERAWVPFAEALHMVENSVATDVMGQDYVTPRDTAFLQEARQYLAVLSHDTPSSTSQEPQQSTRTRNRA